MLAFNQWNPVDPLQLSFPLFTDVKVADRAALGPCVRITGPSEKLYVLTLRYEVYAFDTSVRAAFLNAQRGFFNPTSLCLRVHGREAQPHELSLQALPAGWTVATAMVPVASLHWRAADYDELADSPVEMGSFWSADFRAAVNRETEASKVRAMLAAFFVPVTALMGAVFVWQRLWRARRGLPVAAPAVRAPTPSNCSRLATRPASSAP